MVHEIAVHMNSNSRLRSSAHVLHIFPEFLFCANSKASAVQDKDTILLNEKKAPSRKPVFSMLKYVIVEYLLHSLCL